MLISFFFIHIEYNAVDFQHTIQSLQNYVTSHAVVMNGIVATINAIQTAATGPDFIVKNDTFGK